MDARLLVENLASRGVRIEPIEGNLVVEPASVLTDNDRQLLRRFKPDLLALLTPTSGMCSWCEVSVADSPDPDALGAMWCTACRDAELDAQRNPRSLMTARSLRGAWAGAVFELAELAGFPQVRYKCAHSVTAGEAGWRRFVAHKGVEDLRCVLEALRAIIDDLPQPPGEAGKLFSEDDAQ